MKINYKNNEEFFSIGLYIDNRVLNPRNDTETLVYQAIKEINNNDFVLIDVGTGSACILIAIIKNIKFEIKKVFGLDISRDALNVAKINLKKYNLENKIILLNSNLLDFFLKNLSYINGNFKQIILTANLPYIKNGDIKNMDIEILNNEPHIALFGGEKTGFELYEKLIKQTIELKKILNMSIIMLIEIGFDQYEYSQNFLKKIGLIGEYYKDLNGIFRVIKIKI